MISIGQEYKERYEDAERKLTKLRQELADEKEHRAAGINNDLIQSIKSCRESLINANTRQSAIAWMVEADRLLGKCLKELNQ